MSRIKSRTLVVLCCVAFGFCGVMIGMWLAAEPEAEQIHTHYEMPLSASEDLTPTLSADLTGGLPVPANCFIPAVEISSIGNRLLTLPELFIGANPAVIAINTETTGRNFFGQIVTLPAAGSGFIVSADGYIVTNDHVIGNASQISVMLYNGTVYPARVIGRCREGDLAVLKIEAENLPFLSFGDSDGLMVGEQVAAIGNPLGELANSMTVGHISGLNREISVERTTLTMIQTDASVNRGNSGGPLLNLRGQVIGVITARAYGSMVEGLGFAIPSNTAAETVARLIEERPAENQNQGSAPSNIELPYPVRRFLEEHGFTQGEDGGWIPPADLNIGDFIRPRN